MQYFSWYYSKNYDYCKLYGEWGSSLQPRGTFEESDATSGQFLSIENVNVTTVQCVVQRPSWVRRVHIYYPFSCSTYDCTLRAYCRIAVLDNTHFYCSTEHISAKL